MEILKVRPDGWEPKYGTLSHPVYPFPPIKDVPFSVSWSRLDPGMEMISHQHQEAETYVVTQGSVVLTCDGKEAALSPGDAVYLPPFSLHTVRNPSDRDTSMLLRIWWSSDRSQAPLQAHADASCLITATPPTPNGNLHIGHLSGPYLAGDAYKRYLDLRRTSARFITGIDDHQSYVSLKAKQTGKTSREVAQEYGTSISNTWAKAGVQPDFIGLAASSESHITLAAEFFRTLHQKGYIEAKTTPSLHCHPCDRYLFDAWVHGTCPHCGEPSGGNACEVCGRPNDCADLIDPVCTVCRARPEVRSTTRLYFKLSAFEPWLRTYTARTTMNAHVQSMCDQLLATGLPDICVSHISDWGIPVPVPGFEDQRIYAWFEMAPGYLAANAAQGGENSWRERWPAAGGQIVQCFGFDNAYFHAILFPAIYRAYDPQIRPADTFIVNEFYQLDGSKISTSRNHAIWASPFSDEVSPDIMRFYLAYTSPEREETNFTKPDFRRTIEEQLFGVVQPWLSELAERLRLLDLTHVLDPGLWTTEQNSYFGQLKELMDSCGAAYAAASFSLQRSARLLVEIARTARRFGKSQDHLLNGTGREAEKRTAIVLLLAGVRCFAAAAYPLMPGLGMKLLAELDYTVESAGWDPTTEWTARDRVRLSGTGYFARLPESL